MTETAGQPRSLLEVMLPRVLVVAAAGCTVFLCVSAVSADRTPALAAPAALFLVAAVALLVPFARRKPVRMALAGVMVLAAIGIGAAFFVLYDHNPRALAFGGVFLAGAVLTGLFSR